MTSSFALLSIASLASYPRTELQVQKTANADSLFSGGFIHDEEVTTVDKLEKVQNTMALITKHILFYKILLYLQSYKRTTFVTSKP